MGGASGLFGPLDLDLSLNC